MSEVLVINSIYPLTPITPGAVEALARAIGPLFLTSSEEANAFVACVGREIRWPSGASDKPIIVVDESGNGWVYKSREALERGESPTSLQMVYNPNNGAVIIAPILLLADALDLDLRRLLSVDGIEKAAIGVVYDALEGVVGSIADGLLSILPDWALAQDEGDDEEEI